MIKFLKIRMSNVTKWSFPSCCPFFKQLVRSFSHPHPLIYMWGVKDSDCHIGSHLLGGVKFIPGQLEIFLALAEKLRLKGLSRNKKLADQEVAKKSSKQCESKKEKTWEKSSSDVALFGILDDGDKVRVRGHLRNFGTLYREPFKYCSPHH